MLPLGLRNRLAELILESFDDPEARETLEALAAFCLSADGQVGAAAGSRLAALGWFDPLETGRVRLRGACRPHREALCRRVSAALAALGQAATSSEGASLPGRLARAACLADAGLYFEVHELLEPVWMGAEGPERIALQGLIQVAVGLHHAQNGNRDGTLSLLEEGLSKLAAVRAALPLCTASWEAALAGTLTVLREGAPPPPAPPWPRPVETV